MRIHSPLAHRQVDGMAKIITLDKLRTDYKRFEQKRELLATYDMFLADDRILPMLCKVCKGAAGSCHPSHPAVTAAGDSPSGDASALRTL